MAGATPFLEQTARRRRARRHPAARPEGVHLRRRVRVAVADPQGRSLFRRRPRSPGSTARRRCRSRPSARLHDPDHAADTDGRRGHRRRQARRHGRDPCAAAPQMLVGYLHPEDEADVVRRRRLLPHRRPRPLGRRRYLVVTGRAKDIIIRNGENISPKEVEDILVGHPGIAEIAIVGLPDARTGERACAVIVPADGTATRTSPTCASFLEQHGVAQVQSARAGGHLGCAAEERRGQGPQASDPSDADDDEGGAHARSEWRLTCR